MSSSSGKALLSCLLALAAYARTHQIEGMIVAVDREQHRITLSHREIPGYMPAMVMPFAVSAGEPIERWKPGQQIRAELHTTKSGALLSHIILQSAAPPDFAIPKPVHELRIGDTVPPFTLTDQDGRSVSLAALKGRVVAINFIYTRCPMPEVCPRLTASFAALQRRFANRRLTLLSITLDPQYDTPSVLREYARRSGARSQHWRFLTGSREETARIADLFGVVYWPEEGTLTHTSRTAIIDQNGSIAGIVDGSSFGLRQLADLIAQKLPAEAP